jgi:hypothetical protein
LGRKAVLCGERSEKCDERMARPLEQQELCPSVEELPGRWRRIFGPSFCWLERAGDAQFEGTQHG